ncbi:MAG TPA: hypothetical protein VLL08_14545 [Kineosporiaceae bacterium]|nr:hypothetical protein [Kineosporiaceae bacterium]
MVRLDVRRLAALDMYGSVGATWRRWVILVEFVVGVLGLAAVGVGLLQGDEGMPAKVAAAWMFGVAANYVPLTLHALSLIRPGVLAAELHGVDVIAQLRHYTKTQFWVFVPLFLVVLAIRQQMTSSR